MQVLRIVIQPEDAVEKQTMVLVEVDSADSARRVAESLEGQDIYSDCCTLHIETSNLPSLAGTVVANDDRSFDFTLEAAGASAFAESVAGPPGGYPIGPSGARGPGPYAPYGQPRPMYPYGPGPSAHGSRFPGPYGMSGSSRYPPSVAPPFIQPPPIGGVPAGEESASYGIRGPVMMQMRMPMGPGSAACANPCVMIKGLHGPPAEGGHEHIVTCDLVFNLVCLYGDVVRIKVLISTEGTSMVQMADSYGARPPNTSAVVCMEYEHSAHTSICTVPALTVLIFPSIRFTFTLSSYVYV